MPLPTPLPLPLLLLPTLLLLLCPTPTFGSPPSPPTLSVTADAGQRLHAANPLYMGCHSDSGFVHQVRGWSSQMVFGESFEAPPAATASGQSSYAWQQVIVGDVKVDVDSDPSLNFSSWPSQRIAIAAGAAGAFACRAGQGRGGAGMEGGETRGAERSGEERRGEERRGEERREQERRGEERRGGEGRGRESRAGRRAEQSIGKRRSPHHHAHPLASRPPPRSSSRAQLTPTQAPQASPTAVLATKGSTSRPASRTRATSSRAPTPTLPLRYGWRRRKRSPQSWRLRLSVRLPLLPSLPSTRSF